MKELIIVAIAIGLFVWYIIHKQTMKYEFLLFIWTSDSKKRKFGGKFESHGDAVQRLNDLECQYGDGLIDYHIEPVIYKKVRQISGTKKINLEFAIWLIEEEEDHKNLMKVLRATSLLLRNKIIETKKMIEQTKIFISHENQNVYN